MKQSLRSENHNVNKTKNTLQTFSGVKNVKDSFDKINNSRTDDAVLTKSIIRKNPKLE